MPEYVRVRDEHTGHELSVPKQTVPHGKYVVLDVPAVDLAGEPLPPKHAPKSRNAPSVPDLSSSGNGQKATDKKES